MLVQFVDVAMNAVCYPTVTCIFYGCTKLVLFHFLQQTKFVTLNAWFWLFSHTTRVLASEIVVPVSRHLCWQFTDTVSPEPQHKSEGQKGWFDLHAPSCHPPSGCASQPAQPPHAEHWKLGEGFQNNWPCNIWKNCTGDILVLQMETTLSDLNTVQTQ